MYADDPAGAPDGAGAGVVVGSYTDGLDIGCDPLVERAVGIVFGGRGAGPGGAETVLDGAAAHGCLSTKPAGTGPPTPTTWMSGTAAGPESARLVAMLGPAAAPTRASSFPWPGGIAARPAHSGQIVSPGTVDAHTKQMSFPHSGHVAPAMWEG